MAHAQDPAFSQYYASSLYLNPALAGMETNPALNLNSRTQWVSVAEPFNTHQASFIYPVYMKSMRESNIGSIGGTVFSTSGGATGFRSTGITMSFAYNIPFNSDSLHTLTLGGQGGVTQKRFDAGKFKWGSQFDPVQGFNPQASSGENQYSETIIYPDFNAGFLYSYSKSRKQRNTFTAYLGGAVYHLNTPDNAFLSDVFVGLPRLYKAHGGLKLPISKHFSISPNFLVLHQKESWQYNGGFYGTYYLPGQQESLMAPSMLSLGSWHRLRDSFIFMAGLGNKMYQLGFSFDLNTSSLQSFSGGKGAYEISLQIRFGKWGEQTSEKDEDDELERLQTPRM